jgi:hypothetical protein
MRPALLVSLAGLLVAPAGGFGAEPVDYLRDVKPILTRHCVSCHGAVKPRAGIRLDSGVAAIKGGTDGPAVVPGNSGESPLVLAVNGTGDGERMPLKRPPLSDHEIATLTRWVDQGAKVPAHEVVDTTASVHWAFRPLTRSAPPAVSRIDWPRNPIDGFILARLEAKRLTPSAEADRTTLIRRVSLDLLGLPPAPEEVADFVADSRPDAYERLVDRLLASPHFGERTARPWLDMARYADSNGYSIDAPRSIWKYRDWVINAFNRDMPFNEFAIDQIAGDLRPHATLEQQTATGFHRNTPINQEGGIDHEQFRVESIVDRVNTTGTVFLGLTIGCAQCHDHKYDPISQRDYYRLFAFFNQCDEPTIEFATAEEQARRKVILAKIDAFHKKLEAERPDLRASELAWEATLDGPFRTMQRDEIKAAFDIPLEKRSKNQNRGLMEIYLAMTPEHKALHATVASLRAQEPKFDTTMVVRKVKQARDTHILKGGDFTRPGASVAPGVPEVLPMLGLPPTADRQDLARWLVDPGNPLTARVTMNRLWQSAFGLGLVETENDFGTQGTPPSHPELLDWLASEFVARGWSLKAMYRLVVTSSTYRQSSNARPDVDAIDPGHRLLARQVRLRLDAEVIRDCALAVSGLLTSRVGGPSVFPPQPDGVMSLGQMRRSWVADKGPDRFRRGLYTYFWRATPHPLLMVFDAPNAVQCCTRRLRSNTPLQALTLLNDEAFHEFAQALAARIVNEGPSRDPDRIAFAFQVALGRSPSTTETRSIESLLALERAESRGAPAGASDERGPWTAVARVLLNVDEFITRE